MATFLILTLTLLQLVHIQFVTAADSDGSRDRAALLSFASAVSSDPRKALADWGSPANADLCNWTGVTCHPVKKRVVQLILSRMDLGGVISPAVGNLSFLAVLDLSGNYFSGRIPPEIGLLARLKQLSLATNLLVGSIPAELGFLHEMVYLDLGSNRLSGCIPETLFCNCSSLQYVDLSNNTLAGEIPLANECRLADLRFLLLWSNNLKGQIPASLSNSSVLEWIDLESNFLSGELPSSTFDKMPYLQYLYLSYNNFSSYDGNTNLNPFFASLRNCTHLQELELAGNKLGGQLPSFGDLSVNLVELHLDENLISGPIPPNISNLVNLTYLNLSYNNLNGSIPPDLARLRKLERVYLSNNVLSGHIPPSLGEIPHLGLLDISSNRLTGSIPDSLSNLSQLRRIMLHDNQLSGKIPASLGTCINLEILDLSHNQLTGRIPSDVAALSSLKLYLNLSSNLLEGPIPLELSKMDMILALDLSSNNFSGAIPSQLGSCVALEYLNLSSNALRGPLPGSVGALPYLQVLDVSSNQLIGTMPESLQASASLKLLNISFNNFSGTLPSGGVFDSLNGDTVEGNSGLCGTIDGIPSCRSKRVRGLLPLPVIVAMISTPCIVCLFVCVFMRKSRAHPCLPTYQRQVLNIAEEWAHDHPRISYRQLAEATDGFANSSLIGAGRFGHVYKGTLTDKTNVAVKVLDPKCGIEISRSFKRECQVLKSIRHRNLIRVITACSKPDFKALVLPLMPNGSLDNYLYPQDGRSSPGFDLDQIVSILSDIAEGVAYLHHYAPVRVIHCDLKPSNVLLDEDMTALVSDFGIAKLVIGVNEEEGKEFPDSSLCNSITGLLEGSVGYIAPEYGMGGHPSTRGDVYSFGVVLLEMVTGKRPTDVMFQEGLTLQDWVKSHYPHNVEVIISEAPLKDTQLVESLYFMKLKRDVMVELIELGLICTQFSPLMRPTMIEVAHEIKVFKQDLAQNGIKAIDSSSTPDSSF